MKQLTCIAALHVGLALAIDSSFDQTVMGSLSPVSIDETTPMSSSAFITLTRAESSFLSSENGEYSSNIQTVIPTTNKPSIQSLDEVTFIPNISTSVVEAKVSFVSPPITISTSETFNSSAVPTAVAIPQLTQNNSNSTGSLVPRNLLDLNTTEFIAQKIQTSITSQDLNSSESSQPAKKSVSLTSESSFSQASENIPIGDTGSEAEVTTNNSTDHDDDPESHFMSFEEWKKQKVGKDVQPKKLKSHESRPLARQINHNLNGVIGDDMEIDIGMFSGPPVEEDEGEEGGKLYKERFNYASFDCAATIVKTNSEAKGASSILNENKDSYLLNVCSAPNKFVTIELCQDILVDTVMIGNYEFFSSTFKKIRLSVSDRFPIPSNAWTVLGEFEAENIRALQTFTVKNPLIWAKYLRVEVLSYYGDEFYCPLSVIRVHGQTMIDEFKNEESVILEDGADEPIGQDVAQDISTENVQSDTADRLSQITLKNTAELSDFETAFMDPETISSLNEECSVVLPHLGIEQYLEELHSTDEEVCEEVESVYQPAAIETKEPTTQESIYKNIVKRLSLLESNASLSLLYIEEQSKLLSNAFTKLEKRQTTKFDLLVSAFNETMNTQLSQMKNLYANLQQETALILANQRMSHRHLLFESSRKLTRVSSELTFFKRLAILNTVFILCLLVYVIATRETYIETEYYENFPSGTSNGEWHDFNDSRPESPRPQVSPISSSANSFVNMEKTRKKPQKKKIKFSVSRRASNGTINGGSAAAVSSGSFYFDVNHSRGNSSDEYLPRVRHTSGASSIDSKSASGPEKDSVKPEHAEEEVGTKQK